MEFQDYYKVLGVGRDASEKDIKRAYRRLARKYHPDVNPGDKQAGERFRAINEAHAVLSNPERRAKYDRLGQQWRQYGRAGRVPPGFWQQWTTPEGTQVYTGTVEGPDLFGAVQGFSDFFRQIFGADFARGRAERPAHARRAGRVSADQEHTVRVSLQEAYAGTVRRVQKDGRALEVKIPAGAKTGTRVRLAGGGGVGMAGEPAGDLYLRIEVLPDARFERRGDDLYTTVPLPLYTALLGGEVTIPTLGGDVVLKIPAETANGRLFRVRQRGMPDLKGGERGDLYVRVQIELPRHLSAKERELVAQLAKLRADGTSTGG